MTRLHGTPASGGYARGRLHILAAEEPFAAYRVGAPREEKARLERAIARARTELAAIIAQVDREAGDLLDFQLELLDDADFISAALTAIDAGNSAMQSWTSAVDGEIDEYRKGPQDHWSARADDVADLRERVVRNLSSSVPKSSETLPRGGDMPTHAGAVLVADRLPPSRFLELDISSIGGIATATGSPAGHTAILARTRGIPMIVGCGHSLLDLADGEEAFLDADKGLLLIGTVAVEAHIRTRARQTETTTTGIEAPPVPPALTASGERVRVHANLDALDELERLNVRAFDGVGLVRTEFLVERGSIPSEDEQYGIYRRILDWAAGSQVTIRIFDLGGDKPAAGLTMEREQNPFLGVRGFRLFRHRPDVFRTQMRALARAAVHGELKVMAPMVSVPAEMAEFRAEMHAQADALCRSAMKCSVPRLGMMVEVPSAALTAADFDTDFYSIGTNDLIQYTLAAARDEHRLDHLARGDNPAVLALIRQVASVGRCRGIEVSVCGNMASDPDMVGHLLEAGIRELSVAPGAVASVKQAIRQWPARGGGA